MTNRTRQEEIREIQKKEARFYCLLLVIICIIGAALFGVNRDYEDQGYWMNLVTEGIGVVASIGITVFIIDRLYAKRDREQLKYRLVREARSRSNDIAISAVEWLRDEDWLTIGSDSLLKGARLRKANLQEANLLNANLQGADLTNANLQGASLGGAHLQGANLSWAFLQGANLSWAFLQGVKLTVAKLQGANLVAAQLRGADLTAANLQGADSSWAFLQEANLFAAHLRGANLTDAKLQGVTLPDGNKYTDNIDIKKFTDPTHPEFAETLEKVNEIRRELRL